MEGQQVASSLHPVSRSMPQTPLCTWVGSSDRGLHEGCAGTAHSGPWQSSIPSHQADGAGAEVWRAWHSGSCGGHWGWVLASRSPCAAPWSSPSLRVSP